jgi:3-hydroxyacyl-CoA dehydrogenase
MIGRAWALVFARAGKDVILFDPVEGAATRALAQIESAAGDLKDIGLVDETPATIAGRCRIASSLADALANADYVQENGPEDLETKKAIYLEMDGLAGAGVPLASSTSGIRASDFSADVPGRDRCLVAHPVNPPSVVPLVELSPAPWTSDEAVAKTRALMEEVGQQPTTVLKEIDGFILNRLQGALLNESMRLVADGYVSTADLDRTVKHGLGLRWSFMGPMETIDLNAPKGVPDYSARYGPIYYKVAQESDARPWDDALYGQVAKDRREILSLDDHTDRQAWRDRRLMALAKHKKDSDEKFGT